MGWNFSEGPLGEQVQQAPTGEAQAEAEAAPQCNTSAPGRAGHAEAAPAGAGAGSRANQQEAATMGSGRA